MIRSRLVLIGAAVGVAALALGGCGNDGGSDPAASDTDTTDVEPDADRYCELSEEIGRAYTEAVTEAGDADEFEAAEAEFLEDNAELLDEQVAVAPDEIDDEAALRLDALRRRADGDEFSDEERDEIAEASEQLQEFEQEECFPAP